MSDTISNPDKYKEKENMVLKKVRETYGVRKGGLENKRLKSERSTVGCCLVV